MLPSLTVGARGVSSTAEALAMSMIGNLRSLSDADVARLLAEPSLVSDYLDPEDDQSAGEADFGPFADLDIDKAWHGIHFLLSGSAWEGEMPAGFLVIGGQTVGDVDVGYGPARAFMSEQVRQIAAALAAVDEKELRRRFDPTAMTEAEIYPTIWDSAEEDDTLGYLAAHYDALRSFVADAAERGVGLLVYVT